MTTAQLIEDLKREEGLELEAYPDPLSGGDPWTIGHGHTGPEVGPGLKISPNTALQLLKADIEKAEGLLDAHAPWWRSLDAVRQDVLADLCFNMGWLDHSGRHGLGTFQRMLGRARNRDFPAAAACMQASLWFRQVGRRGERLAHMMLTGARP
jgi:lysozyme